MDTSTHVERDVKICKGDVIVSFCYKDMRAAEVAYSG